MSVVSSHHKQAFQQYEDQQPQPMDGVAEIDPNAQNQEPQQCLLFIDMHEGEVHSVRLEDLPIDESVWLRSGIIRRLAELCVYHNMNLGPRTVLPMSRSSIEAWVDFRPVIGPFPVEQLCEVLMVASMLADEEITAATVTLLVSMIRTTLLMQVPAGRAETYNPVEYQWDKVEYVMQEMEKSLKYTEMGLIADQFTIQELVSAPHVLLRHRLESLSSREPRVLDLGKIEMGGEPNAWRAGMHRVLTAASEFEFSELRVPNFLGTFTCTADAQQTYTKFDASLAWNVRLPRVKSVDFHPCRCMQTSTPQGAWGTKHCEMATGPHYKTCKCQPLLPDLNFVCQALTQLQNVRSVALPSFSAPPAQFRYGKGAVVKVHPNHFCPNHIFLNLLGELRALTALDSLLVRQLPTEQSFKKLLFAVSTHQHLKTHLTRLEIEHSLFADSRGDLAVSNFLSNFRLDPILRLSNLRHLVTPLVPDVDPRGPKPTADAEIRMCLTEITKLTALTFLRGDYYSVAKTPAMNESAIGEFLAKVARELKVLADLKVLHIMCPKMHCAPMKNAADVSASPGRLQEFMEFAGKLDDVIIRGIGCDLIYGVLGSFKNSSIPALSSFEWVDNDGAAFSELRNSQRLEAITNLQHLTELQLSLTVKNLTSLQYNAIADTVAKLTELRKIRVTQGSFKSPQIGRVLKAGAGLTSMQDLEYSGPANWDSIRQDILYRRKPLAMAPSVTRLVLRNLTKKEAESLAAVLDSSQFPLLEVFRTPAGAGFMSNKLEFLSNMPKLRELEVAAKKEVSKFTQVDRVGVWIGQLTNLTFLRLGLFSILSAEAQEIAQHMTGLRSLASLNVHLNLNEELPDKKARDEEETRILEAVFREMSGSGVSAQELLEAVMRVNTGAKAKDYKAKGSKKNKKR